MSRPNLLVVLADQFRAASLGCLRQDPTSTPALDGLALGGRVCTSAVSTYPVCSPARAMLLSGRYPWSNGVPHNVNSATAVDGVGLRPDVRCWSDVLGDHGYRLGYIGKWHLTPPTEADEVHGEGRRDDGKVWDAWTPPEERHGFEFWYSHGCCDRHFEPHFWSTDAPRERPHRVRQYSPEHETDVALRFLREAVRPGVEGAAADPFALVVSINPPHQPFDQVPARYLERYAGLDAGQLLTRPNVDVGSAVGEEAARVAVQYFAAVTAVDEQVGRLLAELEALGVADDTVVLFTSDHGMQLGSHGLMYKNVPFEESFLVPFVLRWPGRVPAGFDDVLIGSVDVAPTLLGLLGLADHIPLGVDGVDCSAALLGQEGAATPQGLLYLGPASLGGEVLVRGLRTRTHKLVVELGEGGTLTRTLFDLRDDPYEQRDVAGEDAMTVLALERQLVELLERSADPWPGLPLLRAAA